VIMFSSKFRSCLSYVLEKILKRSILLEILLTFDSSRHLNFIGYHSNGALLQLVANKLSFFHEVEKLSQVEEISVVD
jgi:hypothetical protein